MAANVDLEKGHVRRSSSDGERPETRDSRTASHHDDVDDEDDDDDSSKRDEKASSDNQRDLVSAATVCEPSGVLCSPSRTRSRSRASSTCSRPLTIVPRAKRRGLFARFALVPEVARPYDYKDSTKWTITTVISLATAAAPMGSSIVFRTLSPLKPRRLLLLLLAMLTRLL